MSIRSILTPVDGASDNRAILENALGLARPFAAHVEVLHVRGDARDAVPMFGEGLSGDMIEEMISAAEHDAATKAATIKAMFDGLCEAQDVPQITAPGDGEDALTATWREEVGREDELVAWRGRLSDLTVTARPGDESSPMRALTLHAALFECGRPVLVLPTNPAVTDVGRIIAIAWNGTAQAARAVQAAMPLITRASEVYVLSCESTRTEPTAGDELAGYLGWWGVSAKVVSFPPGPDGVGESLLEHAANVKAGMLVCGAYTHSRLMQTVLGGVTSTLMDTANIPVFFSH